jgi:hypothetical protein
LKRLILARLLLGSGGTDDAAAIECGAENPSSVHHQSPAAAGINSTFPLRTSYGEMNLARSGGVEKSLMSSAGLLSLRNGYFLHTKSIFDMKLLVPLPHHCHTASAFEDGE